MIFPLFTVIKSVTSARMPGLSGQCNNSFAVVIFTFLLLSVTNHQIEAAKITNYCQYINNKHNKFIAKDKKVTYRKIVALKNTKLSQPGSSHREKPDCFF